MLNKILNSQTKTVTFAAILLGLSAGISAILGLIRDRLLAGRFGAGVELDIYFAAFRIPDFIYGILIVGGITAAFLPVFSEHFQKNSKEGWELTNNVLNCFLILLIFICLILSIFTPLIIIQNIFIYIIFIIMIMIILYALLICNKSTCRFLWPKYRFVINLQKILIFLKIL